MPKSQSMLQNIPDNMEWGAPQREHKDKQGRVLELRYLLGDLDPSPSAEQSSPKPSLLHSSDIGVFSEDAVIGPWTLGHHTQGLLFAWIHDTC